LIALPADRIFRHQLTNAPLTMQSQPEVVAYDGVSARITTERRDLSLPVRKAKPAIALLIDSPGSPAELWEPVPDLLGSPATAPHFTTEVGNDGRATVRFGDDEYGRRPTGATAFTAVYRIGNGRAGNVGAEALAHAVQPAVAPLWPAIRKIRNPLPAEAGTDPETIEEVRQLAPAEFRAEQFRAVVESDYSAAAAKLPEVAGAVASFRWTGSWYTVFVGIDPADPEDLITEPGGRTRLAPDLAKRVGDFLKSYKLAGYDLEIRSAEYVPLEIALELCVEPDYFRGDVVEAVREALSNRVNADGSPGFFHPDRFTFAQPVYLSQIYAAIEAVQGVLSVFVTIFRRFGKTDNGELATGVLPIGAWEIARLDNDPSFQENGVLRITAGGGK
jgi:predicted phage baseplate assembly protein